MVGSPVKVALGVIALVLGLLIAVSAVFLTGINSQKMRIFVGIIAIIGLVIAGVGGLTIQKQ